MKIQDLLRKDVMIMDLKATTKEAAIDEMITNLVKHGVVTDFDVFKQGIMNREAQTSTGLGDGIAMPHSKNEAVKEATVLFAKSSKGVDYESLDGQPTDLFFMIAAPEGANDTHLAALAELSKYLLKDGFTDTLRKATTPADWFDAFDALEEHLGNFPANRKKVVFFDEMPWIDTQKSDFVEALENFWNGWANRRNDIVFVGSGSATSWMVDKLIENQGGLHARITANIYLRPFNLKETEEYLCSHHCKWDRYQIAQCYMLFGGIPFYLSLLKTNQSLVQNVDRHWLSSHGDMVNPDLHSR